MKAIFKTTVMFVNPEDKNQTFRSKPDTVPAEAPDWIQTSEEYALGLKDGSVIPVTGDHYVPGAVPNAAALKLVGTDALAAEIVARGPKEASKALSAAAKGVPGFDGSADLDEEEDPAEVAARAQKIESDKAEAITNAFKAPTADQLALIPEETLLEEQIRREEAAKGQQKQGDAKQGSGEAKQS